MRQPRRIPCQWIIAACLLVGSPLLAVPLPLTSSVGWAQTSDDDRLAEADRLLQQGIDHYRSSQFREALETWQAALEIYRILDNRTGEAGILNNIGIVNDSLGNYATALNYYQQSLVIQQAIGDRATEAITLNNIGIVNRLLGNYPTAPMFSCSQISDYQATKLLISYFLAQRVVLLMTTTFLSAFGGLCSVPLTLRRIVHPTHYGIPLLHGVSATI